MANVLCEMVLALAWFCYDFVTYPFGLFSSTIIEQLNPNNTTVQNIGYGVGHHITVLLDV